MNNLINYQYSNFIQNRFLIIFYLVIFEGAIRKWIFHSSGIYILLIKDILILTTIHYAFKNKIFNFNKNFEKFLLLWTFLVLLWIFFQLVFKNNALIFYLVGFRNWVLYMWFSLICYRVFDYKNIYFLSKYIIFSLIILAPLSIIQHFLPVDHFLNSLPKEGYIFQVVPGIVRTTSTFSHVYGYTQYIMFICPLIYVLMFNHKIFNLSKKLSIFVIFLFFIAVATSGSRGTILFTILMLLPFILSRLTIKFVKDEIFFKIIGSVVLILVLYYFFPVALEATSQRFEQAGEQEDMFNRLKSTIFGSKETWENISVLGNGIGLGSNIARSILGNFGYFAFGEFESDRVINEGGILGLLFNFIKIFSFYFVILSFKHLRKEKNQLAFFYWSYLFIHLNTSQITGQVTSHAFTYLALGFGMVLIKDYFNTKEKNYK